MTSMTFFLLFIPILAAVLLGINLIFAPHNPYQEKNSPFECGYHSFLGQNRIQFSISFFIFALLFLLFDLEILLIYPYVVSSYTNDIYGLIIMLIFFLLLTLGFTFELGKNALKIYSRQIVNIVKKELSFVNKTANVYSVIGIIFCIIFVCFIKTVQDKNLKQFKLLFKKLLQLSLVSFIIYIITTVLTIVLFQYGLLDLNIASKITPLYYDESEYYDENEAGPSNSSHIQGYTMEEHQANILAEIQANNQASRQANNQTNGHVNNQVNGESNSQVNGHVNNQVNGESNSQANNQTNNQTSSSPSGVSGGSTTQTGNSSSSPESSSTTPEIIPLGPSGIVRIKDGKSWLFTFTEYYDIHDKAELERLYLEQQEILRKQKIITDDKRHMAQSKHICELEYRKEQMDPTKELKNVLDITVEIQRLRKIYFEWISGHYEPAWKINLTTQHRIAAIRDRADELVFFREEEEFFQNEAAVAREAVANRAAARKAYNDAIAEANKQRNSTDKAKAKASEAAKEKSKAKGKGKVRRGGKLTAVIERAQKHPTIGQKVFADGAAETRAAVDAAAVRAAEEAAAARAAEQPATTRGRGRGRGGTMRIAIRGARSVKIPKLTKKGDKPDKGKGPDRGDDDDAGDNT